MERFYIELASGTGVRLALARAQRALRAERATAHPFYWAGFVVVGGAESMRAPGRVSQ
jgi:CHAT domain-containing protein